MNKQDLENFKFSLSKKYLDLAEALHRCPFRPFKNLYITRKYQRKEAIRTYKVTRPPKNNKIDYVAFRLLEAFPLEDSGKIEQGIQNLFTKASDDFKFQKSRDNLDAFIQSINMGGNQKIGYIYRKRQPGFFPYALNRCFIESLPEEIFCVEIMLHKPLESLIVLTFDVYLKKSAGEKLNQLQNQRYLPKLKFNSLLPWKILSCRGGYVEYPSELSMAEAMGHFLSDLRLSIEKIIFPHLQGYFFENNIFNKEKLPCVDVFHLNGEIENDKMSFSSWMHGSHQWWDTLGFDFSSDCAKCDEAIFTNYNNFRPRGYAPSYRLVVLDKFANSVKTNQDKDSFSAIQDNISDLLDNFIPSLVLIEIIKVSRKTFETYRKTVFEFLVSKNKKELKHSFSMWQRIQTELMNLERIELEFKENKDSIKGEMHRLIEFKEARNHPDVGNLRDMLLKGVDFNLSRLKTHTAFLSNKFFNYLNSSNMKEMYLLQKRILTLTLVILILTLASLLQIDIPEKINFITNVILSKF